MQSGVAAGHASKAALSSVGWMKRLLSGAVGGASAENDSVCLTAHVVTAIGAGYGPLRFWGAHGCLELEN